MPRVADDAVRNYECDGSARMDVSFYEIEFEPGMFGYEYDIDATAVRIL